MKGMVFTEFMDMVESTWSLDMVDDIIAASGVASGGAYTAVGTYPHEEMLALVSALSAKTGIAIPSLVRVFGKHLFARFVVLYPRFFVETRSTFQFLSGIEDIIHCEVRKLYPDANLPSFVIEHGPGRLTMTYTSPHPFADLAHGLIEGCIEHFGQNIELVREPLAGDAGTQARFILTIKD